MADAARMEELRRRIRTDPASVASAQQPGPALTELEAWLAAILADRVQRHRAT